VPGEQPPASTQVTPPRSIRWVTILIVSVGLLALASFSSLRLFGGPSLRFKTCFQDVNGLRPGAKVKLAGVDVGTVRDVRAQPMDKACPGAIAMELRTPYELKIPADSVATTATAGILGEAYLEIDTSGASGPPVESGGHLPSKESVKFTATVDQALKKLQKQLSDAEENCSPQPRDTHSGAKPSPKLSPSAVPK
jgi:ABC-type transporter Mla subunit MlaD